MISRTKDSLSHVRCKHVDMLTCSREGGHRDELDVPRREETLELRAGTQVSAEKFNFCLGGQGEATSRMTRTISITQNELGCPGGVPAGAFSLCMQRGTNRHLHGEFLACGFLGRGWGSAIKHNKEKEKACVCPGRSLVRTREARHWKEARSLARESLKQQGDPD